MNKKVFCLFASCLLSFGVTSVAFSESSISTFHQVRSEAKALREEYKSRQDFLLEEQYLSDVKMYQENAAVSVKENKEEHKKIVDNLERLQSFEEANEKWFKENPALLNQYADYTAGAKDDTERVGLLKVAIEEIEASIASLEYLQEGVNKHIKELERSIGIVSGDPFDLYEVAEVENAVLVALEKIGFDENRLEEAHGIVQNLLRGGDGDVSNIVYDDALVEKVHKEIAELYKDMNEWDAILQNKYKVTEALYALMNAFEQRRDIAQELIDVRKWQEELYKYDEELRRDIEQLAKDEQQIKRILAHQSFGKYAGGGMEFYTWDSSDGSKGHQFLFPVEYYETHGYDEYSASTAFVNTLSKYPEEDTMNGMRSLSLHYGRRNPHNRYTVKYNLDMTIPLGESRTSSRALSDDLVAVTRLNEGFNIGPSLDIMRRDGDENVWRGGVGFTFKGDYHYSKENPDFSISPGSALNGYLNWTHAEEDHQMRFGIEGTFNGKSNENGTRYRSGEERMYKAMYNKALNDKSDVMAYFWVRDTGSNTYYDSSRSSSGGSMVRYYGLEYRFKLDENRAWFVRNNNMLSTGTYHNVLTGETVNGRKKHTLGIGYEVKLTKEETLTLSADYFWMKDKDTDEDYNGAEFIVFYNRAIQR